MQQFLLIFAGGGLGAAARHYVSFYFLRMLGPGFPFGTLAVNIVGSLLMGLFVGWLVHRGGNESMRLFFATGVLGGFTTFSAFSLDFANMWQRGDTMTAGIYVLTSVAISILAVFAGLWFARSAFAA